MSESPPADAKETPSGFSGGGRGRGRGRGKNRAGRGRDATRPGAAAMSAAAAKFKGTTEEMDGHTFQLFEESNKSTQFDRTLEALAEYISKNLKNPGDISPLVKTLGLPKLADPVELPASATTMEAKLWEQDLGEYSKRKRVLKDNYETVYRVIWGQCSEPLRAKVKSEKGHKVACEVYECGWLLTAIKGAMMGFEVNSRLSVAIHEATISFYTYKQGPNTTDTDYRNKFMTLVDVLEHYGGSFAPPKALVDAVDATETDKKKRYTIARDEWLASLFLMQADPARYGGLQTDVHNMFKRGTDQYPKDVEEAFSMLTGYRRRQFPHRAADGHRGRYSCSR